jgi:hypothetical protein
MKNDLLENFFLEEIEFKLENDKKRFEFDFDLWKVSFLYLKYYQRLLIYEFN